jgi:hypothetical protein
MLGNTLGAFCGNAVGTEKKQKNLAPFPPSPKGKKLVTLGVCWLTSLAAKKFYTSMWQKHGRRKKIVHS